MKYVINFDEGSNEQSLGTFILEIEANVFAFPHTTLYFYVYNTV